MQTFRKNVKMGIRRKGTNMKEGLWIGQTVLWVLIWFGFMLFYTALDIAIWRKLDPAYGKHLNLLTITFCTVIFLLLLTRKNNFPLGLLENISLPGILLSFACAGLFYLILDKGLDPIFEKIFPTSEESYRQTLQSLRQAPLTSLLQICVQAPILEEILMRGFLLGGLSPYYGKTTALLISALLFAILHFNMVQTLSAFICGIVLGLLYQHTGSILCCIIAHTGYNLLSYLTMVAPPHNK